MVEYAHPELFAEHDSVHFIIVNSSATVTGVANSEPTISGNDFLITENEMKQESFDLTESLCSEDNLKFGSLESTHVAFTIYNLPEIPNLADDEITIYIYFNEDSSTLFTVGTVIVKEDKYSADRVFRNISAYDVLNYLREYNITKWYNSVFKNVSVRTVKYLRDSLFTWLVGKIEGYTIIQEETILVNDDFEIEKSIESDTVTFGFFMSGLLEGNGVLGHVDRTCIFRYVSLETYDQPAKDNIDPEKYFPPLQYKDYHVWGIGFVDIWDRNNIKLAHMGESAYTYPSIYNIIDNFMFVNNTNRSGWSDDVKEVALNIRNNITHMWYYPFEVKCIGNLCLEVGDRIDLTRIEYDENDNPVEKTFYSYILERHFHGIQGFKDIFSAEGARKQPRYKPTTRWHKGDSQNNSVDGNDSTGEVADDDAIKFIKYCRNIGIRLLQEPTVNLEYVRSAGTHQVEITWTDPSDITNYKPVPCAWAGTIVVRSEGSPPVHPWDNCEILVTSTTRDEYSETPFVDDTIEENKKYYYGIFPYHIALDDNDHPIKYYRFTKVLSVNTQKLLMAPLISAHSVSGTTVTLTISIPELEDGTYSYIKVVAKKGSIPASKTDGVVKDVSASATSVTFDGLDDNSHYYFVIFASDGTTEVASDPDDCTTSKVDALFRIVASEGVEDLVWHIEPSISGITPIYDTDSDSLYSGASTSDLVYVSTNYNGKSVTKIEYECEVKMTNLTTGHGSYIRWQNFVAYVGAENNVFVLKQDANTWYNETDAVAPLNNLSQNVFHKLKYVFYTYGDEKLKAFECYVDNNLYFSKTYLTPLSLYDDNKENIWIVFHSYTYFKNVTIKLTIPQMVNPTIDSTEVNGSYVKVNHTIIPNDYLYVKIVAKQGSEPQSVSDGISFDAKAPIGSTTIGYLIKNANYYLKIFAEDTIGNVYESNAVSITTESSTILCDTEIINGVMYNKTNGKTFYLSGTVTTTYDSSTNSISIYQTGGSTCQLDMTTPISISSMTNVQDISVETEIKLNNAITTQLNINSIIQLFLCGSSTLAQFEPMGAKYYIYDTNPLDDKIGTFHKVKYTASYTNGKVSRLRIWVDDNLFFDQNFTPVTNNRGAYQLAFNSSGNTFNVKYAKVSVIMNDRE